MGRLAGSWSLVKASAAVLRADKELLVFPIVSSVGALLVTVGFLAPAYGLGLVEEFLGEGHGRPPVGYGLLFGYYLCQYVVTFYCNTALVGAALIRLEGGDPTVGDGFRVANRNAGRILGYAAISATVGVVMNLIVERGGRAGQAMGRIGGLGWSLATYLVVPVLVAEGLGPIDAVRRSAQLLRKTWGEQIAGGLGMGLAFGLALALTIVLGAVAIVVAAATEMVALVAVAALGLVLAIVGLGLASGALTGIYAAALYRHAMGQSVSRFYDRELMEQAFRRA